MAITEPFLHNKFILYQYKTAFLHFQSDTVVMVNRREAQELALLPNTFYILDGRNADPVNSMCLTLFISSPLSNNFRHWHYHLKINLSYFPVWSLEELRDCRALCYPTLNEATVDARYVQYGGIPLFVFWEHGDLPSLDDVITDPKAREKIPSAGKPSQLFPSLHMLLHIMVDDDLNFQQFVLAS